MPTDPDMPLKITGKNQKLIVAAILAHERLSMLQISQATEIPTRSLASSIGHAVDIGLLRKSSHQGASVYSLSEEGKCAANGMDLPQTKPISKPAHFKVGTRSSKEHVMPARRLIRSVFDLGNL